VCDAVILKKFAKPGRRGLAKEGGLAGPGAWFDLKKKIGPPSTEEKKVSPSGSRIKRQKDGRKKKSRPQQGLEACQLRGGDKFLNVARGGSRA